MYCREYSSSSSYAQLREFLATWKLRQEEYISTEDLRPIKPLVFLLPHTTTNAGGTKSRCYSRCTAFEPCLAITWSSSEFSLLGMPLCVRVASLFHDRRAGPDHLSTITHTAHRKGKQMHTHSCEGVICYIA
jgi:hypothetical protein